MQLYCINKTINHRSSLASKRYFFIKYQKMNSIIYLIYPGYKLVSNALQYSPMNGPWFRE